MQTFVYPDEIYRELAQTSFFATYTEEQLSQDLAQLESWGNLTAQQEVTRARNIAEFKRKKFRYQCTPYTVEIERMVERLGGAGGFIRRFAGDDAVRPVALASFVAAARVRGADG